MDNLSGELQPPVVGRFVDGVGEFFGDDQHEGRPILVRFRWSGITADAARWEQAFSTDRGETWETNWIMTFTRKQAAYGMEARMTASATVSSLGDLGNVPMAYMHEWRVAEPREALVLPGAIFKWYHVHREGVTIPAAMDAEARAVITDAMAGGTWIPEYGLNFALIHLSTTHAFLISGIWRGHQELWERVYYKELAQPGPFLRTDMDGEDVPAACVWELGVICHERMAWHRYLFTGRTEADKRAWLADTYTGRV